jgi:aspartate carbamoyltransferase catalytic subunit
MSCRRSILSILDFDRRALEHVFADADTMAAYLHDGGGPDLLRGKILAAHFGEPSMRTKLSFEAAMIRLGGHVLGSSATEGERAHSALQESLQDAVRVMSSYADVLVVRHLPPAALALCAQHAEIPIINAGSGQGAASEHPTQAVLDLYTIARELGQIDSLRVLIVGSPTKRAARSLILGFSLFEGIELFVCAPAESDLPEEDRRRLESCGVIYRRVEEITDVLADVDVVYHSGQAADCQEQLSERFFITAAMVQETRTKAIVLHPLPRPGSIAVDVDATPNAKYFQAARNGLPIRMALLAQMFCQERSRPVSLGPARRARATA